LGEDWDLTTEFSYLTVDGSKFDGNPASSVNGGILGGVTDSYMTFDLGFLYYFGKGAPSKICEIYNGLSVETPDPIDYERIENIVKKHIPKEVIKEVVVEKPVKSDKKWVLVGVNFDYNSTKLSSEAYPVLFHAVQVLLQNPDMRVEIQGHTDNIGSDKANMKLSEKRAQTVKNYLVARGVDGTRLKVVGLGESQPIADNKTAAGRAMNRRIEFKVLN
jgi:OOP family OmpA-OmpF porin